jgi:DNA sulfur modification protein DndE
MEPPIDRIRISQNAREQLLKLKRATRIEHWNVLCRWALCNQLLHQLLILSLIAMWR